MAPAERARPRANLAAAHQRRESLQRRWAEPTDAAGTDDADDLDVELLRTAADVAEIEERLAQAPAPAPAQGAAVNLAGPPANDAPVPAPPEHLTAREAANSCARARTPSSACGRAPAKARRSGASGARVYPLAGLSEYGSRK